MEGIKQRNIKEQKGFTIPELMLAMSFISVLLILLLLSATYVISTYNKGLTLKRVNQSGRSIGDTLQASLKDSTQSVTGGTTRLCTGKYTFIWTLYNDNSGSIAREMYDDGSQIGFAKVDDSGQDYCNDLTKHPSRSDSTELLGDNLVLRAPTRFIRNSDGKLITAIYTISTPDESSAFAAPTIPGGSIKCEGNRSDGEDFCALNTFVVTSYIRGYNE